MTMQRDLIRHHVWIQRTIKSNVRAVKPIINKTKRQLEVALQKQLSQFQINNIIDNGIKSLYPIIQNNMLKLATYEANFNKKLLQKYDKDIEELSDSDIEIASQAPIRFGTEEQSLVLFAALSITAAYVISKIAKRINYRNLADLGLAATLSTYFDTITVVKLFSIISTATNSVVNSVRAKMWEKNDYNQVEWTAVLDESVCPDCEDLDGTILSISEFEDLFPVHLGCRCTATPIQ